MRFEIEVSIDREIYIYSIAFEFPERFQELRVLDESLRVAGRPIFTRKHAEVHIPRENLTQDVTFRIDWHVIALPVVQERSLRDPLALFKTWLRNLLILRPIPSSFHGMSDGQGGQPIIVDPAGANIGSWFTHITTADPSVYKLISDHLTEVMPDFSKITNPPIGKSVSNLMFHFANGRDRLELALDQLSDGEKCFLLQALVIATSATQTSLVCFWDEPDNFLAPDEVGQSIMALRRAFQGEGQIIVTSHNPEAIRRFSEDNTFCLARRSRLEPTIFKTVSTIRAGGDFSGSFIDALLRGDIGVGTRE